MKKILRDTNAYSAFKKGNVGAIDVIQHAPQIALSVIVMGELFGGFRHGGLPQRHWNELQSFISSRRVRVVTIDTSTASQYGDLFALTRRAGRPVPTNDLWIGASALEHQYAVFTYDAHFQ